MNIQKTVTVFLVDDHAVVREGYKHLLRKANIEVIGEACNGEEAYQEFDKYQAQVIVIDLSMPGLSGIETIKKILGKDKHAKILAFSMHEDAIFCVRTIQAGACGYVTKSSAPDVLVNAVLATMAGKKYISPDIAHKISSLHTQPEADTDGHELLKSLTTREFEVFQYLTRGKSLDETALALHLDYKTIANVQTRLRQKLKVENNAQLVLAAVKLNIVPV
jgi:DNA-binding NarL/FixJ family response regulator